MISTVIKFCKTDKIDITHHLGNPSVECVLTEVMSFLTKMCSQKQYYTLFAEIKKTLVVDVIFPLLRTIESEKDVILEDPLEFVHLSLDCCDKQLSGTFKTQAAQFMERLCESIDGTLTFVAVIAFNLLDYSISSNNASEIEEKFKLLLEYKDSVIVARTPAVSRVETCLLVLSILSFSLPRRPDLMMLLETTLLGYAKFFYETPDALIRNRYCLLISYYIENIFLEQKMSGAYMLQIRYLIENVGLPGIDNAIVALQACDGLRAIFEEEELIPRIAPFISDIVEKFANYVGSVTYNSFFEILQEMVRLYAKEIAEKEDLILILVRSLQEKILLLVNADKKKDSLLASNCWNTLKAICEQKEYLKYQNQIEKELLPLFKYMEKPKEINFDDEVIYIMNSFIGLSKTISPVQWILLKTFPAIFAKYSNTLSAIFKPINLFIIYGKDTIRNDSTIIDLFIKMADLALFSATHVSANEANHSEGAVLMHLLLQNYIDVLTETQFQTIIASAYKRLKNNIKKPFLRARLFGVIMLGFLYRYEATQQILKADNALSLMIESIINFLSCFISHYDRKVFIIGMSSILLQKELDPAIQNAISLIFSAIVSMLCIEKNIEHAEQLRKKMRSRTQDSDQEVPQEVPSNEKIIQSFVSEFNKPNENVNLLGMHKGINARDGFSPSEDDDEEYSEDDDDDSDDSFGYVAATEEEEAQNIIDTLITGFKNEDEYEYFRKVVYTIRDNQLEGLKRIIESLSQSKQEYLKLMLQSHRVKTGSQGTECQVRKVVSVRGQKPLSEQIPLNNRNGM